MEICLGCGFFLVLLVADEEAFELTAKCGEMAIPVPWMPALSALGLGGRA